MDTRWPALTPVPPPDPRVQALWLVDLSAQPPTAALALLSEDERNRAQRFRFERDARRYQASHVALRQVLGEAQQTPPERLLFNEGLHGKPRLLPQQGQRSVHFNLSHSGDWALIGLSREHPMGVDLEEPHPMDDTPALVQRLFTVSEQRSYERLPPEQGLIAFLQGWTRKEACLKALGSGLVIEPQVFEAGLETALRSTCIAVDGQRWSVDVSSVALPINALAAAAVLKQHEAPPGW